MSDADSGEWLTYQQAAQRLGLGSSEAVRSLARRKGWARRSPNRIGDIAQVLVPVGADQRSTDRATDTATGANRRSTNGRSTVDRSDDSRDDSAVEGAGRPTVALAVEVAMLERIVADKDAVNADLRQRLDGAERRLDEALAAQRKATDELKGLQAAVDQQRTMGLSRRLRWALRGR